MLLLLPLGVDEEDEVAAEDDRMDDEADPAAKDSGEGA